MTMSRGLPSYSRGQELIVVRKSSGYLAAGTFDITFGDQEMYRLPRPMNMPMGAYLDAVVPETARVDYMMFFRVVLGDCERQPHAFRAFEVRGEDREHIVKFREFTAIIDGKFYEGEPVAAITQGNDTSLFDQISRAVGQAYFDHMRLEAFRDCQHNKLIIARSGTSDIICEIDEFSLTGNRREAFDRVANTIAAAIAARKAARNLADKLGSEQPVALTTMPPTPRGQRRINLAEED